MAKEEKYIHYLPRGLCSSREAPKPHHSRCIGKKDCEEYNTLLGIRCPKCHHEALPTELDDHYDYYACSNCKCNFRISK